MAGSWAAVGDDGDEEDIEDGDDSVPLAELPELPDCPPLHHGESQAGLQKHGSAVAEMVSYLFGGMMGKQQQQHGSGVADAAAAGGGAGVDVDGSDVAGKGMGDQHAQ
jgi:hypothetical protein